MANEKIHEYLDVATLSDVQSLPVMIDCDVQTDAGWLSKQLNVNTIIEASNDTGTRIFGSYHDETIQIHTNTNVPKALELSNIDFYNGMMLNLDSFNRPTILKVPVSGIYNLQFSAQINRTTGGTTEQVSFWCRQNGIDVPASNTHMNVVANSRFLVASWNFYFDCQMNDELQLIWSVTALGIKLDALAPDLTVPHPATPSLIVTISKI